MGATSQVPDEAGRFGAFGGRYVPETLTRALDDLTRQYDEASRDAAFQACRHVIDTLKETVPIWKKEFFEGGEVWIEGRKS